MSWMNGNLFGEDTAKRFEKKRVKRGYVYLRVGLVSSDDTPGPTPHSECTPGVPLSNTPKDASEDASDTSDCFSGVPGVGTFQETPYSTPKKSNIAPLCGKGIHRVHQEEGNSAVEQPVEPNESAFQGIHQGTPRTEGRSLLEIFWEVGKKHGYPEIPDLDLKSGKMGWNSFSLAHRLRIPDVIARLGGVQ